MFTCKKGVDNLKNANKLTREKLESIADTLRIDYIGKDYELLRKGYRCSNKNRERI